MGEQAEGAVQQVEVGGPRGAVRIGAGPLVLIAGPCLMESEASLIAVAAAIDALARPRGLPWVFKSSFDKANRTSLSGARGPGLATGLAWLAAVRAAVGVPVSTDLHLPEQAIEAAKVADLLQIPAFLCRQTDLLMAAGATGLPVHLKKGQFMAPSAMGPAVRKLRAAGAPSVLLTERGTTFGHGDLVVDMRGLRQMRALGVPVAIDATHAAQRPGGLGEQSGGDRSVVGPIARAAVAVGVDAVFLEVHPEPERAPSDGAVMVRLSALGALLDQLLAVHAAVAGA